MSDPAPNDLKPDRSNAAGPSRLDPRLTLLLQSLRQRVRRFVVLDSLLAIAAVVLTAFWIGLAMDYLPVWLGGTEMPRLARLLLLIAVAVAVIVMVGKMLIGRLRRDLPDDSLALLVERHHPPLGGRLVTAVQLGAARREGDSHSPSLLRTVHDQAAAAIDQVDPQRVFRGDTLWRKALVAGPLAVAGLIFLIVSPSAFGKAASRLTLLSDDPWPRRAELRMVGVELPVVTAAEDENLPPRLIEFDANRSMRLPIGSSGTLRIAARADGAELPVVCTAYYQTESGSRGQANLRRIGRVVDGFQAFILDGPPLTGLSESTTLDIRGLDDRLDDYEIVAVAPPAITSLEVAVRYPDYLRDAALGDGADRVTDYQAGLRIREGSRVTLRATSNRTIGDVEAVIADGPPDPLRRIKPLTDDPRRFELTIDDFTRPTSIRLVPGDPDAITAQAPYRYFLGVVEDQPPELELRLDGIGTAITPIAKIPARATVTDDYGVSELTLSVSPSKTDQSEPPEAAPGSEPVDAPEQAIGQVAETRPRWDRDGLAEIDLDLRDMVADGRLPTIAVGDSVTVIAEANDAYNLGPSHRTRSDVFQLQVVTPDRLLSLLERRELGLRARLEQTISETRNLRETLSLLRRGFEDSVSETSVTEGGDAQGDNVRADSDDETVRRDRQVRRLRVQQSSLQVNKTASELTGIAESLDDILREMINNRVDSVDRRERIADGVRDPLRRIVADPLSRLDNEIGQIDAAIDQLERAQTRTAVALETADEVLLDLTAILEKMLDLESYNELLDIVRELIDDQEQLLEETKSERKKRVLDLFD